MAALTTNKICCPVCGRAIRLEFTSWSDLDVPPVYDADARTVTIFARLDKADLATHEACYTED